MLACVCGGILEVGVIGLVGSIMLVVNIAVGWYNRCKCCKPVYRHDPVDRFYQQFAPIQKGGQNLGPSGPRPETPPQGQAKKS